MKRIAIYSNCIFSFTAIHAILCNIYAGARVTKANSKLDLIDADFVIFIINEYNLLQYSEFFIKYCKHLPYKKFIMIGESEHCKLLNALVGCQYKNIDISLPIKELRIKSEKLMLEKKSQFQVETLQGAITPNEIEVITMLAAGLSLTQIAILKKRSLKTVSHHKCNFFRKLGVKNRACTLLKIVSGKNDILTFISA